MKLLPLAVAALAAGAIALPAAEPSAKPTPPPYLSPEESAKLVELPPGYRLELVLGEPDIREPVISVFDGNGRLYVAEMRTYMQDADGADQKARTSRVSVHWSSRDDGRFDRHAVFADNLLLPRMVLPLRDSVLIQETDTGDVIEYRDTDGDGTADEKKLFHAFERRAANLEHQPAGLVWALDNWIYTTMNAERIRWTPRGVIKEATAPNSGQWGLAQDDRGKPWFVNAMTELGPVAFQQPVVYGMFRGRDEFAPGFKEVFPLVGLADVQGGTSRFRPAEKTLNHITAAAGIEIVRGDRLPADLRGDLLFNEPVGRLIRRAKIEVNGGITTLRNAHGKSEFLRSADPFFRPVNLTNAPDGTVYITDMYRGIIQEGNWTRKGAYLRGVIDAHGMADKVQRGRIWRLVHESLRPGPRPRMLDETPAELVAHLAHPNGWWRDTAQKLLVLAQDKSVVPALRGLARTAGDPLARVHALWTLEGLDALDAGLVREAFKDGHPSVRIAALRACESLVKAGDRGLAADLLALCGDADVDVSIQAMLSANLLKLPEARPLIARTAQTTTIAGLKEIASQILNPIGGTVGSQYSGAQRQQLERGQGIYLELCFACHGIDGKGTAIDGKHTTLAPPLAGSATVTAHRDALVLALLHGMAGPIDGRTYEAPMAAMGGNDDAWIAAVASYVRTSFGNQSTLVAAEDVARVRARHAARKDAWTHAELTRHVPQAVGNRGAWKLTTNRPATASAGADQTGPIGAAVFPFNAKAPVAGTWLQIELPEAVDVAEVRLISAGAPRNYTRSYKIEVSRDGERWGEPVASGRGPGPVVDIAFAPVNAKWVRITHTQPFGFGRAGAPAGSGSGGGPTRGPGAEAPGAAPAPPREGFGPPPSDWTLDDVQLYRSADAPGGTAR